MILIVTSQPQNAAQVIVSIYWVKLLVPPRLLVIGASQTSLMVGGFWSKALLALWEEENDPSAVCCGWDRLSCYLTVGIHTSGISIPLSLLMLLGWSLMWIASWKRYVDDTFTVLKRNNVEDLLQHRNTQQPTIRFTMESENDNTIPFLDT